MSEKTKYPIITKRTGGDVQYLQEVPDPRRFYYPVMDYIQSCEPTILSEHLAKFKDVNAPPNVERIRSFNFAKAMILDLLYRCVWDLNQWLSQSEIHCFTGISEETVQDVMRKKYCRGDFANCARYIVCMALGREHVPPTLVPSQIERARDIIARHKELARPDADPKGK